MTRVLAALLAVLGVMTVRPADAEMLPARGERDSRVRSAPYEPDEVYRLPGFVGYQIHLQFESGEEFVGLGAGDIEGLSFVAQGNSLFLKPKAAKVATNLTVLTSRRHYQFEYWASSRRPDPDSEEVIYALRFTYPPVEARERAPSAAALESALDDGSRTRKRNFDYAYCGARAVKPAAAFDDGVHTYLRFAPRADLPALFVRNADGSESLVNFTVEADMVVLHRVAERIIVRRGRLAGCVVNRAFEGSGTRLESGTVSPQVLRKTRGGEP